MLSDSTDTVKYLRMVRDKKSEAITDTGGALNYRDRFVPLEPQIMADYHQAIGRLQAAYQGLAILFGYGNEQDEVGLPTPMTIENLITLVRNAISWLVRFTHRDHSFSLIIPVKPRVGDTAWKNALSDLQSKGSCLMEFPLDGKQLNHYCFARIAGITAAYVSNDCKGVLQADVTLPRSAISVQKTKGKTKETVIDQKALSPCRLGRVVNVSVPRPPEVAGAISQRNASPIGNPKGDGKWRVQLNVVSGRASGWRPSSWRKIDELELELQMNATPR